MKKLALLFISAALSSLIIFASGISDIISADLTGKEPEFCTSEGCSNCPSADNSINATVEESRKKYIPVDCLAYHVDYREKRQKENIKCESGPAKAPTEKKCTEDGCDH